MKSYVIRRYINQIMSEKPEKENRYNPEEMILFYMNRHEMLLELLHISTKGYMSAPHNKIENYEAMIYKITVSISKTKWQIQRHVSLYNRNSELTID